MTDGRSAGDLPRRRGDARGPLHPVLRAAQSRVPAEGPRLHASRQDRDALPGAGRQDPRRGRRADRRRRLARPGRHHSGYETARHLGVPAIWVEREGGSFKLRRFELAKGARVVVVEDIVTTGLSVREAIACLRELGAEVLAVACLIDRSAGEADVGGRWWRSPSMKCLPIPPIWCPGARRHPGGEARQPQPMIIGIGSDLIDIRRIERSLERHGERFIRRIFTEVERARSERRPSAPPPMPSASRPRRRAPRRSDRALSKAFSGATWASSICRAASRPCV